MLHNSTHPTYVEGCAQCRWASANVAPSATPSRRDGARAAHVNRREANLAGDLDAYKRLRADGLQPLATTGARRLELAAECVEHVETARLRYDRDGNLEAANRMLGVKPRSFTVFSEETGVTVTTPQTQPKVDE